jgi:predicted TIM-barrel fold metal-dependent hydrolase
MIIDAHCHLAPTQDAVESLLAIMAASGIAKTVMVPGGLIPELGLADYLRGRTPLAMASPDNGFLASQLRSYPDRLCAFYHVVPSFDDEDDLEDAITSGFCGFKFSPLVDRIGFSDPGVQSACRLANERGFPVYTHVVANGDASLDAFEPLPRRFPKVPFILGHMGFAGTDQSAIQMAYRYENLFLETSVGSVAAIREAVRRLGPGKVIFGSEGPVHHPLVELRKIEVLGLPGSSMDLICAGNINSLMNNGTMENGHDRSRVDPALAAAAAPGTGH